MHDIPLNDTQRIFADKNHNLVYKFLHEKNLPASEYYYIVIFGYLRAVQRLSLIHILNPCRLCWNPLHRILLYRKIPYN